MADSAIERGIIREVIVIENLDCSGGVCRDCESLGKAFIAPMGVASKVEAPIEP